jgi:hypothetical protein
MEREGSLPCQQQLNTETNPDANKSSPAPYNHISFSFKTV